MGSENFLDEGTAWGRLRDMSVSKESGRGRGGPVEGQTSGLWWVDLIAQVLEEGNAPPPCALLPGSPQPTGAPMTMVEPVDHFSPIAGASMTLVERLGVSSSSAQLNQWVPPRIPVEPEGDEPES